MRLEEKSCRDRDKLNSGAFDLMRPDAVGQMRPTLLGILAGLFHPIREKDRSMHES